MKKKFIRVMFFGALALATGASFVGCKDYDDDIDAVNARVDGIEKTLSELQTQVGGYVKSVVYDASTGKLTVTGADSKEYTIPLPEELPSYTLEVTKDGKITLKKNGQEVSSGTIDIPEIPEIPTYKEFDPLLLTVKDGYVYYDGTKTSVAIPEASKGSITAIIDEDGTVTGYRIVTIENGKEVTGEFSVIDAMPLKGLVFEPTCYVGGISALKANNLTYNAWSQEAYAKPTETGETYKTAATASYITPQIWAYYHMNPASVSMAQIESLKFLSGDKDYYPVTSRAAAMDPTVNMEKTDVVTEDGQRYLKVAMDADAEKIPALNSGKVAVYALQAQTKAVGSDEAKVITSDYASVYKVLMSDFVLKTQIDTKDVILYGQSASRTGSTPNTNAGKAQEAIDETADYTVATDGTLKLADKISTYYKENNGTELVKMTNIKDNGLKYVFTASNYIGGANNETEQNSFFNGSDAANGIINPEYKGQDSEATENREPLLRVELVDTTKIPNQVVAVGWIKTKIVKGTIDGFSKEFTKDTYYYGCENNVAKLTYLDMNDVYAQAKLNKTDFHTAYKLKKDAGTGDVILGEGSTGKVTEVTDPEAIATTVVEWTVTPEEALALVDKSKTEMFASVTYESVDGTRGNITITMKASIAMPSGVIKNDQKITQAWSADKSYVKADVKEPVTTAVTDFKLDLFDVFEGRTVVVSDVTETNFPSFAKDKLTAKFIFSGAKDVTIGADKYTFTVTNNGTQLNASKNSASATKIATIDANGIITYNKVDENAKVLLNKSAYNVDPFTVGIEIVVTNECDELLPLTGNKFDVKFLRPINVVDLKSAELQDATTGTAKIDMSKLLGLTDWRGKAFAVTPVDFYNYYGVDGANAIAIDKDKIMTTLNASEAAPKLLKDVAPNMSINYTCNLQKTADDITYGDLVYENGKFTINAPFKLFIPVTVKYTFGEVTSTVTLTITPTHD